MDRNFIIESTLCEEYNLPKNTFYDTEEELQLARLESDEELEDEGRFDFSYHIDLE